MTTAFDAAPEAQERYQVRLDVGLDGARRIGESAHLLVWCDGLVTEACPVDALPPRLEIIDATLGSVGDIAQRLLALQAERVLDEPPRESGWWVSMNRSWQVSNTWIGGGETRC